MSKEPRDLFEIPEPDAVVLDLDAYRKKREAEGTWPISREEHFKFFYNWKRSRTK